MGALHSAPWCVCAILAALAYFGTLGTSAPEPASAASERGTASRTARACHAPRVAARKLRIRRLVRQVHAAQRNRRLAVRKRARLRKAVRNRARCARIARAGGKKRTKRLVAPLATGPTGLWRPYAVDSPWNVGVGSGWRLHERSGEIVERLVSWGRPQNLLAGHADSGADYYHPIYFSSSSDPVFELDATMGWGRASIEGHRIRIPDAARPAGGGDGHLAVVTEDGWEYDLWAVSSKPSGGGRLEFGWGGRTRIDGDGLGSNATAAWFGLAAGVIRAPELEAGRIEHALFMGVRCTDAKQAALFPAQPNTGEPCSEDGLSNVDAPPMGARFVLDMTAGEIAALDVPDWKKTILRALAEYGMFVGDAIGSGAWGLQFESGSTYTSFGQPDPLARFAENARGVGSWNGMHVFNLADGIDWKNRLKVLHPCETQQTC